MTSETDDLITAMASALAPAVDEVARAFAEFAKAAAAWWESLPDETKRVLFTRYREDKRKELYRRRYERRGSK